MLLIKHRATDHDDTISPQAHPLIASHTDDIPNADMQDMMKTYLEDHYRKTLDDTVPALNNMTPRQCAKNKKRRAMLLRWVKEIEQSVAKMMPDQNYDFSWFRQALGFKIDD